MKKTGLFFFTLITVTFFLAVAFSTQVYAYPGGAPAGYTGSPGDGQNCTKAGCHGGSAATVNGWITSNIPTAGYTAGTTYDITVSVTGSGNHGFEVSPQNVTGTLLGSLIAGSGNKLVGSGKYVTQSSSQNGNPQTWSFQWVAPATGTGSVTLYGAFCVTKSNTKLSTLVVNENPILPLAVIATATPLSIIIGQTSQLNASASGGSGSYTYSWTSVPAGFTSNLQNPLVSPTVTTQYIVTVNDGSATVQGNVTVTVTAVPLSATATATPSAICAGQTSQLNVIPAGGSGAYTYSWTSIPAGFTSTLQNPVVSPIASTQYIAHVTDGALSVDAPTNVTVNQPATAAAGSDTNCAYTTAQIPLNGSAANYSTVLWTTSGSGTFSAAASLSGIYFPSTDDKTSVNITLTLTATPQAPCAVPASSVRHIHFDGPEGIGDSQNGQFNLTISPNPSTGLFALRVNGSDAKETSVMITDIHGKMILQHIWTASSVQGEQIDMSAYPKGFYLIKIQTEKESTVRKLVIE